MSLQRQNRENNLKKNKIPLILGIVVTFLLVFQVIASNGLATAGSHLTKIESEIENYTHENATLKEQVASASSLMTLSEKAKELGFVRTSQPVYLTEKNPMALDLH